MFLVEVSKNQVNVVQKEPITSGSVNAYLVSFSFSEEWEDLTRVAVFKADADPVNVLLDDSNECFIPWEVMTNKEQPILFGVYGSMGSKVVLPTVWANAGTTLEGVITGLEGQEPQPNLLTQLTGRIKDLEDALKNSSGGGGGSDGVSPTITVTEIDGGHRITITDVNGEQSFDVMDGKNGVDGTDGDDGFSPIVNVTEIDGGHRITIANAKGEQSFDVLNGLSPSVLITEIDGGHSVSITDANGEQSFDVLNGQNGENGTDGKSAYQIAVENGFDGSEEEWLESLKGQKGDHGDTPSIGPNGNWWIGGTDTGVAATGSGSGTENSSDTVLPVKAPVGCIVWWSGSVDNVPTGWHICDGEAGTLDLRDKFILAAGPNHPVGETGGEEEVTLTVEQMPSHTHQANVSGILNASSLGSGYLARGVGSTVGGVSVNIFETGSSEPHPNMPPYYALCAIQKISPDETDSVQYEAGDGVTFSETEAGTTIDVTTPVQGVYSQEEYDALPEEQRNKGLYVVDDGQSGGIPSNGNGEIYSTEETRIGTWIDGKPLYRRVFTFTTPTSADAVWYKISEPIDDLSEIVSARGAVHINPYGFMFIPYAISMSSSTITCGYSIPGSSEKGLVFLNTYGPCAGQTAHIVIEYTKTTDPEVTA